MTRPTSVVLIVDDDSDMLNTMRDVLENEGLTVTTAADGIHALDVAREQPPDLAVLDITLPGLGGQELARQLRELRGEAFPVLAVTADGRAAEKARLLRAYAFVRKPFDVHELVQAVEQGLRR
jgi:DNA-binding response OmpR family regulator